MDDLGQWPPPPPPLFADPEPEPDQVISKRVFAVVLVGLLALAVLVGGAALVLVRQDQARRAPVIDYPQAWDPRIKPLADQIARDRQLAFRHPVTVRFLEPKAFEKTLTSEKKDEKKEDQEAEEQFAGLLRAFGLLAGDVDLGAVTEQARGALVLAYYSLDDKTVTVRGTTLTPAIKATLMHELTHVLQDQNFDIAARLDALHEAQVKGTATDSEATVLDAVVEGDAERMGKKYASTLPAPVRKQVDQQDDAASADTQRRLRSVPKIITSLMSAPYVLGRSLVEAAAQRGGNGDVDILLRTTPKHDSALLDPLGSLAGGRRVAAVPVPKLGKGEKRFDSGEFGPLTLYLMLAERLPLSTALRAADAWGEDGYVAFTRGGTTCSRIDFRGKTAADTDLMAGALRAWSGPTARVSTARGTVRLDSCDPGRGARLGQDASEKALTRLAARATIGTSLLGQVSIRGAQCIGNKAVEQFTIAQLSDPKLGKSDPADAATMREIGRSCAGR